MNSLARYHGRSPRYILDTEDNNLIRIAGPKKTPWEEGTEIKNVSLTGLSFTAADDLCPLLGEVIKIQFIPPGSGQMACYGIVTRLENNAESSTLVGVHFYKMELAQRVGLAQGLSKKIKLAFDRGQAEDLINPERLILSLSSFPQFLVFIIFGFLWASITGILFHLGYDGIYKILIEKLF